MNYNVIYNKSVDLSTLRSGLEQTGATLITVLENLGVITLSSENTDFSSVAGVIAYEVEVSVTATPCSSWHLQRINVQQLPLRPLYLPKNYGANTTVYLVDFGIDATHPELVGSNITNLWSYNNDFSDPLGHGTSMASLIVGQTLGVVKEANLKVVKIPYGAGVTNTTLLQAFDAVLADHMLTPNVVKVVNCSWIVDKSQVLDMKIAELQSNGLVVVAAAGNGLQAADNYSPVGLDTVIGVAACDAYDRVISWGSNVGSNYGPEVDVTAPGIDVSCAQNDGTIGTASGTSLASAITSGVVAQFISDNPTKTALEIQTTVLQRTVADILFRNETIYGTTPNRLLQCLFFEGIFIEPNYIEGNDKIYIQKGTTQSATIVVAPSAPITRLSIEEFNTGRITRIAPDWVSFNTETNVITFSPPADLPTKKYMVYAEALNGDDVQVSYCRYIVHVYETSPSELNESDMPEYYTRNTTTNTVIAAIGYCYQGNCPYTCGGLQATKSGNYCFCVSYWAGPCAST